MRTAPEIDPVELVPSVLPEHSYHCPDLHAVDAHLLVLSRGADPRVMTTSQRKQDIDRLLDRRVYMALVA